MDIDLAGRTAVSPEAARASGWPWYVSWPWCVELAASGARVVTGAKTPSPEIEALAKNKQATFAEVGLNLMAAVRATRAALPGMLAARAGIIVMTCSVNARLPDPAVLDYSPAKAGLAGFAKALPKEVGSHGIRVNTVSRARSPC